MKLEGKRIAVLGPSLPFSMASFTLTYIFPDTAFNFDRKRVVWHTAGPGRRGRAWCPLDPFHSQRRLFH